MFDQNSRNPDSHRPLGDGLSAETTNGYSYITSIEDAENAGSGVSTPEQYQNFNTQSLQEGVNPFSNYPPTPEASPVTQEYFFRVAVHPVLGMTIVVLGRDNTILWVYGPPLGFDFPDDTQFWLMQNSRVLLPRLRYQSGAPRRDWVQRPSVLFFVQGRLGIKLPLALEGKTEIVGMNIPRGFPLAGCSAITIRINFPGYCSSTEVDKKLTDQCEIDGRKRARSMRVATKVNGAPVTLMKLAKEASKRVEWHISDLKRNRDLFPFDPRVGERWRLGQGRMKPEYMVLTGLRNDSHASWSCVIELDLTHNSTTSV